MGNYIHFTEEQKYRANNVDLVDFLYRRGRNSLPAAEKNGLHQTAASLSVGTSGMITRKNLEAML